MRLHKVLIKKLLLLLLLRFTPPGGGEDQSGAIVTSAAPLTTSAVETHNARLSKQPEPTYAVPHKKTGEREKENPC